MLFPFSRLRVDADGLAPAPRGGHAVTAVRGTILLFGGADRSARAYDDLWQLHIGNDLQAEWTRISAPFPSSVACTARSGAALVAVGDRVYLFGGQDPTAGVCFNDIIELDTSTWTWTQLQVDGPRPPARHSCVAVSFKDQCMVVYGGAGLRGALSDLWVFNCHDKSWSSPRVEGQPPVAREMAAGVMVGCDKLLIHGGRSSDGKNRSSQNLSELWCHLPSQLLELDLKAIQDVDSQLPETGFQPLKLEHLTVLTSLKVSLDRHMYMYPGQVPALDVTADDVLPSNLASLTVYDCRSADPFSGLSAITRLVIDNASRATSLPGLRHLASLRDLELCYRRPTWPEEHDGQVAQAVSEVAHMWPSLHRLLRRLEIHDEYYSTGTGFSATAMEHLGQLTGLTTLDLSMCPVDATPSQFARSLSKLRNLVELSMVYVQFTVPNVGPHANDLDEGTADGVRSMASALASCRNLRRLDISDLYPVGARAIFRNAATMLTVLTGLTRLRYDHD